MSEQKESARRAIQELVRQFEELNDEAESIRRKMDELSLEIQQHQAVLGKSSHELETMPEDTNG